LSYRDFFFKLTEFYPHLYQERVEEHLRAGDSLILRVPTGAGKTWAAVAPFLFSLNSDRRLFDRILYALPLRSLASSLQTGVFQSMAGMFGDVRSVGNDRNYGDPQPYCSLQIGGQKDDSFFQSDLIFTTIDQLLSGYLFLPVSLPDRVGNINAGALVGSLIVLDEIHLLDSAVALGTVVEMLDRLRGLCQFVLMTATTTDRSIAWLRRRLGAKVIEVPDSEIRALPSQSTKQRSWRWCGEPLDAQAIIASHTGGRTIALLNSVRGAQDLFLELEKHYDAQAVRPRLLLLHSRFYPEDRKAVEDLLSTYFGPRATLTNAILVTTQVIEAGMDLSADDLHSELAPMNALVQRAGRCARYVHRPIGRVTIYEINGRLGPYREYRRLIDATRLLLVALPPTGRSIDFAEERGWVETVHAESEEGELKEYNNLYSRRAAVHKAMDQGERGRLSELVRDIDSVGVLVSSEPAAHFGGRGWPRLLSLPRISLMSLRPLFTDLQPDQWVAKGAVERDDDERPGAALQWETLTARQLGAQWLVAIHPDFASYDTRTGLRLGHGGPERPQQFTESPPAQHYDYQFEPWADHSARVVHEARAMREAHSRGAERLARGYSVRVDQVEELVSVTCALHDTGKLTPEWQEKAWLWQDAKDARARTLGIAVPVRPRVPIAHTWYESAVDWPFRRDPRYKFPAHAVQGAFAVCEWVAGRMMESGGEKWGEVAARCALTAIARHHGTRTKQCTVFRITEGLGRLVGAVVPGRKEDVTLQACSAPLEAGEFSDLLLAFGVADEYAWALYAFLVRRLRLADQRATANQGTV
jgi:CRISPR-associated endonuclease/helicase Cas3